MSSQIILSSLMDEDTFSELLANALNFAGSAWEKRFVADFAKRFSAYGVDGMYVTKSSLNKLREISSSPFNERKPKD